MTDQIDRPTDIELDGEVTGLGAVPFEWNLPPIEGLTPEGEIALALRLLHNRGYDDDFYGHITLRQDDGTYLTNPWELMWDDLSASDMMVMDFEGRKLRGRYSITPGVNLHLAIRRFVTTPATNVIIHQHPRYGTLWATRREVPPIYEQGGSWVGEDVYVLKELEAGDVIREEDAHGIARARCGLLGSHGVVVLGESLPDAVFRAVVLEQRCQRAWQLDGVRGVEPLSSELVNDLAASLGPPKFVQKWWEASINREARRRPEALL